MNFIDYKSNTESKKIFKDLYFLAFPREERRPMKVLDRLSAKNKLQVKIIFLDNKPIGLVVFSLFEDILWIDYLAIDPRIRSKGLGKKVLDYFKENYADYRIFVEVETPDLDTDPDDEKNKRVKFYEKNGFSPCHVRARVFGCDFSLYSINGRVSYEEYENTTKEIYGIIFFRIARYKKLDLN